jgi:hypothetical protein
MRPLPVILALFCFARLVAGAEDPARAQIRAATRDATTNLLDEVSRVPLTRTMSVGDFLNRTGSTAELVKALQGAQQIGGARWIDDNTCQIELQISGPLIANALKRAAANSRRSPLTVTDVERAVATWNERSFSATGSATSRLPVAQPRRNPKIGLQRDPWWDVAEAAREQTVTAAKADAARRCLASIKDIVLTPKSKVGDLLAVKEVSDAMQKWLVSQPAARVELHDDLEAEVELTVAPADAFTVLRALALKQSEVAIPGEETTWAKIKAAFDQQMEPPVGRAVAAAGGGGPPAVGPKPLGLPQRPPVWVTHRLEATASSAPAKSKLLAARAAEAAAEEKLRRAIETLQLNPKQSIAQAAKDDPRIDKAIARAVARSKLAKAVYYDNGSADVLVYLDLDALWQELHEAE